MISAFRIGPAASGRGLYDIDKVLLRIDIFDLTYNRCIFVMQGYHSPRPLAAGSIRNAGIMESLLR